VWNPLTSGAASMSVDQTRAYRGSQALHVHVTPPADGGAPFSEGLIYESAAMPDPLYVRAFVYLPPSSLTDGPVLLDARQLGSPYGDIELGADSAGILVGDTLSPPFTAHSSAPIATNRWLCIEWRVAGAGGLDTRTWVDGTELSELHRTGAAISPSFGLLRVGVALVAMVGSPAYDLWFDEIEIDSKPIGCLK
jgi:hypothetical protein